MNNSNLFLYINLKGYALYIKEPLLGPVGSRKLLTIRGFVYLTQLVFNYWALLLIPASDLIAIKHCSIIFTAILSRIFLKELIGIPHLIAILMSFVGVAFIAKPTFIFGSDSITNDTFNQTLNVTKVNDNIKNNELNTNLGN